MSPYMMMAGGQGAPVLGGGGQQQQTPPDFTNTAAGANPGGDLTQKNAMLDRMISEANYKQAQLKYGKDQLTQAKTHLQRLMNQLKGSV